MPYLKCCAFTDIVRVWYKSLVVCTLMALVLSGILDTSGYFISSTIAYDIESFGSFLNGKKLKSTIVLSHIENTTEKISVLMAKRIRVR